MARPTTYATPICLGTTVVAAVGVAGGLLTREPLITVAALVPAAVYEAYRTEGDSTRWASWALLATVVAEIVLLAFGIGFDLAAFLGETERTVAGVTVPLGDIRVVGTALMVVLSGLLLARTRGVYTRWLAAVIGVTAVVAVWIIAPDAVGDLVRRGVDQAAG